MDNRKEGSSLNESLISILSRSIDHHVKVGKRRHTTVGKLIYTLEQDATAMAQFGFFPKTRVLDDVSGAEVKVSEIDAMSIATDVRKGKTVETFVCADGKVYSALKSRRDYPTLVVLSTMSAVNLKRNRRLAVNALSKLANLLRAKIA